MVTKETTEALRILIKKRNEAIEAAEKVCGCSSCTQERLKKQMLSSDKAERDIAVNLSLMNRIVKRDPSDFIPQLSPDYEKF
jgi:hypothetical protein